MNEDEARLRKIEKGLEEVSRGIRRMLGLKLRQGKSVGAAIEQHKSVILPLIFKLEHVLELCEDHGKKDRDA